MNWRGGGGSVSAASLTAGRAAAARASWGAATASLVGVAATARPVGAGADCRAAGTAMVPSSSRINRCHHGQPTVSRPPSAVRRQPSAVSRQPSAVSRQPSAVSRQPSAVSRSRPPLAARRCRPASGHMDTARERSAPAPGTGAARRPRLSRVLCNLLWLIIMQIGIISPIIIGFR